MNSHPEHEQAALRAVEHHHAEMLARLQSLVAVLVRAVEAGDKPAAHDAHGTLVEWCETELLPHALAEEGPLYGAAHEKPEGRLLVDGMLAEHQVLVDLVAELRESSGMTAAITGNAIGRIFAMHLEKENRLLLPFIAAEPDLSLADAVEGLHEIVGEAKVHGKTS